MTSLLLAVPSRSYIATNRDAIKIDPPHMPAVDGLRGIAVVLVLACHALSSLGRRFKEALLTWWMPSWVPDGLA